MKFVHSLCVSLSLSLHFAYTSTSFCRYRYTVSGRFITGFSVSQFHTVEEKTFETRSVVLCLSLSLHKSIIHKHQLLSSRYVEQQQRGLSGARADDVDYAPKKQRRQSR